MRVAPFFAWRALVVASPIWYNVAESVRAALLCFIEALLEAPDFDPARTNSYLACEEAARSEERNS